MYIRREVGGEVSMSTMIAKVCLFLSLAVAIQAMPHHGGTSTNSRKQDDHGNYAFGYQIVDHHGNTNGRQEAGHGGHHVHGSYNLGIHDGRVRKVEYVADKHGFRAAIKTNEPGTQHSLPAAVDIDSPYKGFAAGSYGISHGGYGGNDGGYGRGNGAGYGAGRGNGGNDGGYGRGNGAGYGYGAGYGGYGGNDGGYGGNDGGYGGNDGGYGRGNGAGYGASRGNGGYGGNDDGYGRGNNGGYGDDDGHY